MNFLKLSQDGLGHMCMKCPLLETMLRPYFDNVKTLFGLSLAPYQLELWIFFKTEPIWSKSHVLGVCMFLDPVNSIYWPCWNHIWHSITSKLAGALKSSRLSQYGWKHTPVVCLIYGPWQGHVWTLFGPQVHNIPWLFVHYFQILMNFLYICQSVSWLTSLLILDKCRNISCSGWNIFLIFLRYY